MKEDSDASESDADPAALLPSLPRADSRSPRRAPSFRPHLLAGLLLLALAAQRWRELGGATATGGGAAVPQTSASIR